MLTPRSGRSTPFTSSQSELNLETRLEKVEKILHITDEMAKLRQDQDDLKFSEIERSLEDMTQRLRSLEQNQQSRALESLSSFERSNRSAQNELSHIKEEILRLVPSSKREERLTSLESDMNFKMSKLCETMEEIVKNNQEKGKEIVKIRKELKALREHRDSTLEAVGRELIGRNPLKNNSMTFSVEYDEEDIFLNNLYNNA